MGGFILDDILIKLLTPDVLNKLDNGDIELLQNTHTPYDVIGIIFEDVDFLDVGEMFEIYKRNPEILSKFLQVDLDYYQDLMDEDIKYEYNSIKETIPREHVQISDEMPFKKGIQFKEIVLNMVQAGTPDPFQSYVNRMYS